MTTAEQWERLARDANAAAVKAMAEADRLRAELAALRAAGGPSDADVMKWVTEHPYFGDWDTWAPIAYDHIPVLPRMALSHLYGRHAERESPFAHCVFCELFDLRAAGGQEKPNCPLTDSGLEHRPHHYLTPVPWDCPGLPAAPVGGQALNIVFDGPPGPMSGRFIEVENDAGVGVNAGEWSERPNGWWALRIPAAGGQEKPTGLQDYIAELRRTAQLVSPIKVAARLSAIAAAPVGGQEKPNDALAFEDIACAACGAVGEFHHIPAAPVGGQAEPSDAEWGVRQQPSGSVTVASGPRSAQAIARNRGRGAEAVTRHVTPWAAAAVSGEQP